MNPDISLWRRERHVVLWWLLGLVAALGLLGAVTRELGQQHLRDDAERTALRYADVVAATVPGLEAVFEAARRTRPDAGPAAPAAPGGRDLPLQAVRPRGPADAGLRRPRQHGAGAAASGPSIAEHQRPAHDNVQQIVLGGQNFIELKSGAGKPDRPPWYSEAYVPVLRDGRVIGVVEVYVDQTRADAGIRPSTAAWR